MALIAVPFIPFDGFKWSLSDENATKLLEGMLNVPAIFSSPGTRDERRIQIASMLTNPKNKVWTVWQGADMVGVTVLVGIAYGIDAEAHFVFFDKKIFGRKALIYKLLGVIFQELKLQRVSVEIPEHLTPLIRFVRSKLGFKYEGEDIALEHPATKLLKEYVDNPAQWLARIGARRESAYWRSETEEWVALIRLRLLRSEYDAQCQAATDSAIS
jgi:hypothetical protein